jgi:hypothetical protein
MNEPNAPANSTPAPPPPLPPPLVPESGPAPIIEALLKRPATLIAALQQAKSGRLALWLAIFALLALAAYGLVVGSFSGGRQMLAAPLKISLGALASLLICLPSLFIFACLTGADVSLRAVAGTACAVLALAALLLIGFAPVAWVFSQSTSSVAFMGSLHLVFWLIGLGFGLRLLLMLVDQLRVGDRMHLKVWSTIFIFVSLQMTTALRPIVGTSERWLPAEKKFFIVHWIESIARDAKANAID